MDKKFCSGLIYGLNPKDSLAKLLVLARMWSKEDLCVGIECVIDKLAVEADASATIRLCESTISELKKKIGEYEEELNLKAGEIDSLKHSIEMLENKDPFGGVEGEDNAKPSETTPFGRAKGKKNR